MSFLLSLLIVATGLMTSTASATPNCEGEMSTAALRFLVTLRGGVNAGQITSEDLEWMAKQPQPVDPIRASRNPDTLFFKQQFRAEIPRLSPAQWKLVVAQALELGNLKRLAEIKTSDAREETKFIFSAIPIFRFPPDAKFVDRFTSARGEIFIAMNLDENTLIYNFSTGEKFEIPNLKSESARQFDFFEATNGEVLFAAVQDGKIVVRNLTTSTILLDLPKSEMFADGIPLLYETKGTLNLMIGKHDDSVTVEARSLLATHDLQIVAGQPQPVITDASDVGHAVRLKDGHLYTRRESFELDKHKIVLRDRTLDREIFDIKIDKIPSAKNTSMLTYERGPKLILQGPRFSWFEVDPKLSAPKELAFNNRNRGTFVFHDHEDQTTHVRIGDEGRAAEITIEKVLSGVTHTYPLARGPGTSWDWTQENVPTPRGMWTYGREWDMDLPENRLIAIRMFNLDTQEDVSVAVNLKSSKIKQLFYSPADGRILMIAGDEFDQLRIFQVYGPEERTQ